MAGSLICGLPASRTSTWLEGMALRRLARVNPDGPAPIDDNAYKPDVDNAKLVRDVVIEGNDNEGSITNNNVVVTPSIASVSRLSVGRSGLEGESEECLCREAH